MSRTGFTIVTAALLAVDSFVHAQSQPPAPQPLAQRAPDALERVTWRTRTLVGDDRLTRWKFAVPSDGVGVPTFLEAVVRADAAVVDFVEGTSTQKLLQHQLRPRAAVLVTVEMADSAVASRG